MSSATSAEQRRLAALHSYDILDTEAEQGFDDIVHLASEICQTPVALVSLVAADRQWFKARVGFEPSQTPISQSVCAHAIQHRDLLVIPDLTRDERTEHNSLVTAPPHIRFYAGAVLETPQGEALGTLCVIDQQPRPGGLTPSQGFALEALARQVMTQLELRRAARAEAGARKALQASRSRYEAVFASAVDYAIIVVSPSGAITDWSQGATRLLGWTADEIRGRDFGTIFTSEDRAAGIPQQEIDAARATAPGDDGRWHLRKNGERVWTTGEMRPLRSEAGALEGFVKILRDRTEARLAEERLQASRAELAQKDERLQMALAASGTVGLWDWQIDTDKLHGDANFARLYGLEVDSTAAGLTMEEYQAFVVPEDLPRLRASIRAVFDHGADFLIDYRLAVPGRPLRWVECKGKLILDADGNKLRFSGTAIDITDRKEAEQQRHLLMEELSHRVKNTFAVVQAITAQTLRRSDPAVTEILQRRLQAFGQAHDILLQKTWSSARIHDLLNSVLRLEAEGGRFDIAGPELEIAPSAALSLSMLMHEMTTNAVKYGALSVDGGSVILRWTTDATTFRLQWRETGGPPAKQPAAPGFGSRLITMGIRGCRLVTIRYLETGLDAEFAAPLSRLLEE